MKRASITCLAVALMLGVALPSALAEHESLEVFLSVDGLPYAELVDSSGPDARRGHLLALGAMQKVRGVWRPADSERVDGTLWRFTWRALEMVPSAVLLEELQAELGRRLGAESVFSCDARACGSSAQWANRIFDQRLLYGTEASQRYRVLRFADADREYRVLLYASARTSDRQYLHAELLEVSAAQ